MAENASKTASAGAITAAKALMEEVMKKYDPSHDRHHVDRVRRTAMALARSPNLKAQRSPDLLVVELAALLHDVLDKKYVDPATDPDAYFAPFFFDISEKYGLDLHADGRAEEIVRIIENVSWTTEKRLRAENKWGEWHDSCVELHCVQDADRLDAIGAFGIMRCAAFSAISNRPFYVTDGATARTDTAIEHFYDKLLHIKERLKTEPGRLMGSRRHDLMLQFLEGVKEEATAII